MKKRTTSAIILAILVVAIIASVAVVIGVVKGNEIDRIVVSKSPDKVTYTLNDPTPVYDGIWLQVIKKNGSFDIVKDTSLMIFSGFDTSKVTDKMIVGVNYEGFVATFALKVEEAPKPTPKLVGIYLEKLPEKLTYTVNDKLVVTGGVIVREYSDGSKVRVNLRAGDVTGFVAAKAAGPREEPYALTVTYEEPETGVIKTTTYDITITE